MGPVCNSNRFENCIIFINETHLCAEGQQKSFTPFWPESDDFHELIAEFLFYTRYLEMGRNCNCSHGELHTGKGNLKWIIVKVHLNYVRAAESIWLGFFFSTVINKNKV